MYRTLVAAAFAVTAIATPAFASSTGFKMDVQYSKANLATPASAAQEYDKIREQIVERCEIEQADMKIAKDFAVKACTERTLTTTVRAIGNANLSQVHANR
jgi:UrcA family protein